MTGRAGRSLSACAAAVLLASAARSGGAGPPTVDPFEFFRPAVVVSRADRQHLDRGDVIVRNVPARDGEVGVFSASRIDAPPERLLTWTRAIEQFKESRYVLAIRRFSEPPVLEDLDGLVLGEEDLSAIRRCRPGNCGVKLAAGDMTALRATVAPGADAVQDEFKRLLLQRVETYRQGGFEQLAPYADHGEAAAPYDLFAPHFPGVVLTDSESFFYWSREQYGTGKPVIGVTHITIVRSRAPEPEVLVLSRGVYATHYRNASFGLTAMLRDDLTGATYLAYMNRSHLDVLGGLFGGLKRALIEDRLRQEAGTMVRVARARLERGDPVSSLLR